jgi:hypothetical protein
MQPGITLTVQNGQLMENGKPAPERPPFTVDALIDNSLAKLVRLTQHKQSVIVFTNGIMFVNGFCVEWKDIANVILQIPKAS